LEAYRVEIIVLDPNTFELKLYDSMEDKRYRSWKIPMSVATAIASWWQEQGPYGMSREGKRTASVLISMLSSEHVDIKEFDRLGHPKLAGWSLPVVVVEAL